MDKGYLLKALRVAEADEGFHIPSKEVTVALRLLAEVDSSGLKTFEASLMKSLGEIIQSAVAA
jgi:hypothetical protein